MMSNRSRKLVRLACNKTLEQDVTPSPLEDTGLDLNSSSDLDDTQINIATQMVNFVDDDALTGPSTSTGKNYSDLLSYEVCYESESLYVADLDENASKRADYAMTGPSTSIEKSFDEHLSDEVCLFGSDYSDKDPTYVPDSDDNSPKRTDCNRTPTHVPESNENSPKRRDSDGDLIIPESPSILQNGNQSPEELAKMILETIMELVWKSVKPLKRRKRAQPSEWKKNISKARKIEGLPYVTKGVTRSAKVPKPVQCDKCFFKCTEKFTPKERENLCRNFQKMDFKAKKNFILSCIKVLPVKTRKLQKTSGKKDRSFSKKCFFQRNNEKVQVCQKFFITTLCISVDVISDAIAKVDALGVYAAEDQRGKKEPPHKTKKEDVEFVKQHIEAFPVMESHYCRKDSKKKYLASDVKSVNNMYRLYEEKCTEEGKTQVSAFKYRDIFIGEYNYSFFNPKKDLCGICTKYEKSESKEVLKNEYQKHIQRKTTSEAVKETDKVRANTDETFMSITMDLQAVLQIPSGGESILYYLRKLVLYNFTIYEARLPNNAYCLCWSEINGKKGSCEIGTCLFHYLSKEIPKSVTELSIFSDTCSGQNRNQHISALLLWAVQKIDHLQIIEQKFLESGHSHMEVDSMHAAIENASKNLSINSVSEWKNVFKSARKKRTKIIKSDETKKKINFDSYKVKEFKFNEMLDLKKLSALLMKNKNKDNKKEAVNWLKIKKIRYVKGDLKIYFNYDLSEDYRYIDIFNTTQNTPKTRAKRVPIKMQLPEKLEPLYQSQLPISNAKKKDLETMCRKQIIPEEFHGWINGLKTFNDKPESETDTD